MESKCLQTRAVFDHPNPPATVATAGRDERTRSIARIVANIGALVIEAVLIWTIVVLSLGLGADGQPGLGPSRLATPPTPEPALDARPTSPALS